MNKNIFAYHQGTLGLRGKEKVAFIATEGEYINDRIALVHVYINNKANASADEFLWCLIDILSGRTIGATYDTHLKKSKEFPVFETREEALNFAKTEQFEMMCDTFFNRREYVEYEVFDLDKFIVNHPKQEFEETINNCHQKFMVPKWPNEVSELDAYWNRIQETRRTNQ